MGGGVKSLCLEGFERGEIGQSRARADRLAGTAGGRPAGIPTADLQILDRLHYRSTIAYCDSFSSPRGL